MALQKTDELRALLEKAHRRGYQLGADHPKLKPQRYAVARNAALNTLLGALGDSTPEAAAPARKLRGGLELSVLGALKELVASFDETTRPPEDASSTRWVRWLNAVEEARTVLAHTEAQADSARRWLKWWEEAENELRTLDAATRKLERERKKEQAGVRTNAKRAARVIEISTRIGENRDRRAKVLEERNRCALAFALLVR